jgi:hypothetical protein
MVTLDPATNGPYPATVPVGMTRLLEWLLSSYGGQSLGILAKPPRPVRGGTAPSVHNDGRALDWRWVDAAAPAATLAARRLVVEQVLVQLVANADRLNIQRIHDYAAGRAWQTGLGWRTVTSTSNGWNQPWAQWLHIERNLAGAADDRPVADILAGAPPVVPPPPVVVPPVASVAVEVPTLRQGASGAAVARMQHLLAAAGERIDTDGRFGPGTDAAVRVFQGRARLTADGIVGPRTWEALIEGTAA